MKRSSLLKLPWGEHPMATELDLQYDDSHGSLLVSRMRFGNAFERRRASVQKQN
jgi:hypothetical protein